jgi:uncharacterized membrane protein
MASIQKDIVVRVPVRTAYNQWTQFETFPQFMEGVREVRQLDPGHLAWRAQVGGKEESWEAEITEQVPDRRISWRSISGVPNSGAVDFEPIDDGNCKISLALEYEPQGLTENVGSALGFDERRVEDDLQRFKTFIESQGTATGAYRGEIQEGRPKG